MHEARPLPEFKPFDHAVLPADTAHDFKIVDGVFKWFTSGAAASGAAQSDATSTAVPSSASESGAASAAGSPPVPMLVSTAVSSMDYPSMAEFRADYAYVLRTIHSASVASFCYRRLELLEAKFGLHKILNQVRQWLCFCPVRCRTTYPL